MKTQIRYKNVSLRTRNALQARIDKAVEKYGYQAFRLVAEHYIKNSKERQRLAQEIRNKEIELAKLKGVAR